MRTDMTVDEGRRIDAEQHCDARAHKILTTFMSMRPLIAICGTTGVGKSKFAIELALKLDKKLGYDGARIINADSMQVYSGMDIITNKVPEVEMKGVEHLLMGFKKPGEQYIVGQWVSDAVKAVSEFLSFIAYLLSYGLHR